MVSARPQKREKLSTWLLSVCVVVILWTLASSFVRPMGTYDEGFSLTNAWRILGGEFPHRDYWAAYPPGTSLTLAGAFHLFHPALWVARLVNLGWSMLLLWALYALLAQFASARTSLLATVMAALWVSAALYPSYSVTPALALTFLTLALLFRGLRTGGSVLMLLVGVAGGAVLIFRHDFSGYLYLSLILSLSTALAFGWVSWPSYSFKWLLKLSVLWLGVTILGLAILLWVSGFDNFWQQAIVFPLTGLRATRSLPFPGVLDLSWANKSVWLLAWFVPGWMMGSAGLLWAMPSRVDFPRAFAQVLLASMAILLTLQARNRLDLSHVAPSVLFALCLVVVSVGHWETKVPREKLSSWAALLMFGLFSIWETREGVQFASVIHCAEHAQTSHCMAADDAQTEVVEFVNQHLLRTDAVYVGNTRHDKIFINDASLYFQLGRPIPVKWNEMHPGVVTTEPVQKAMIQQIEHGRVKLVVLADMPESSEANASATSSHVLVLDDYIKRNYRPVFSNKRYTALRRMTAFESDR